MTAVEDERSSVAGPGPAVAGAGRRRLGGIRTRRGGAYAAVVGLGLVLVVLLALTGQRPTQPLDPEGPGPEGAMALAEVLRDQGVEVDVVRSIAALEAAAADRSTTVLVGDPTNLGPGAAARLAGATRVVGRLVVVGGSSEQLDAVGLPAAAYRGGADALPARCASTVARDDDVVSTSDTRYLADEGVPATACFVLPEGEEGDDGDPAAGGGSGAAMLELPAGASHPAGVLVGFGEAWTNEAITDESNAGLAVRALGSTPRLVWYQPGPGDLTAGGPGEQGGPAGVWPVWVTPAAALLGVVVVLLALSRGRRLGRLVREPLPVVVRAVETTESRGRLYRRSGDRGRAAAVLRAGTRDRLARRLAVAPAGGPVALVHAVASATHRPAEEVGGILFGADPHDDRSLIQLAQQLTDLEERAQHP